MHILLCQCLLCFVLDATSVSFNFLSQVLSMALPPPPEHLPALGWPPPPAAPSVRGVDASSSKPRLSLSAENNPRAGAGEATAATAATTATAAPAAPAGADGGGSFVPGEFAAVCSTDAGYTPSSSSPSSPLLLIPRPRPESVASSSARRGHVGERSGDDGGAATGQNTAIFSGVGGVGGVGGIGGAVPMATVTRGRGVIAAIRGGRTVLLDTHPANAPPSPPPQPPPPQPPLPPSPITQGWPHHDTDGSSIGRGSGASIAGTVPAAAAAAAPAAAVSSFPGHPEVEGSPARKCARVGDAPWIPPPSHPADDTPSALRPTAAVSTPKSIVDGALAPTTALMPATSAPRIPGSTRKKVFSPNREQPPLVVAPVAEATSLVTLGSMCKRGRLVRATRKFSCLSVVGVRFAKVATWCKNCGMVSGMFRHVCTGTHVYGHR